MGWDAYAVRSDGSPVLQRTADGAAYVSSAEHEAFAVAADAVGERGYGVDGLLRHGALDCGVCADAIKLATGMSCYGDDWTADDVRRALALWRDDRCGACVTWAALSARAFLETCARLGLGVEFSW